jgi:hypothetical protein
MRLGAGVRTTVVGLLMLLAAMSDVAVAQAPLKKIIRVRLMQLSDSVVGLRDVNVQIYQEQVGTLAPQYSSYEQPASGRMRATVRLFVLPNEREAHVVVVNSPYTHASQRVVRRLGVGVGATAEQATQAARADLLARHPSAPAAGAEVFTSQVFPANSPESDLTPPPGRPARRVYAVVAWKNVRDRNSSSETAVGYEVLYNPASPPPTAPAGNPAWMRWGLEWFASGRPSDADMYEQGRERMRERGLEFDRTRVYSRAQNFGSTACVVVLEATMTRTSGQVITLIGVGMDTSNATAHAKAERDLKGRQISYDPAKHPSRQLSQNCDFVIRSPEMFGGIRG